MHFAYVVPCFFELITSKQTFLFLPLLIRQPTSLYVCRFCYFPIERRFSVFFTNNIQVCYCLLQIALVYSLSAHVHRRFGQIKVFWVKKKTHKNYYSESDPFLILMTIIMTLYL